ncbi:N-6 DNA methylase [Cronobacter sakazakii]|uniref:N-6 DNA methylase n=1 Tax=Cronobacter sakazakii TaxID=28141 RepID=UPI003CEA81DC
MANIVKNIFCSIHTLKNEADVETFFVIKLLASLGYRDENIKPKYSLQELSVKKLNSRRAVKYRPDYGILINKKIRMIIEAKSPSENLEDYTSQARDYCATINGEYEAQKPVKYFLLTNGNRTILYKHDLNKPLLELGFEDFNENSKKYKELKELLSPEILISESGNVDNSDCLTLKKAPLKDVNEAFAWCHQFIYKNDNISQGAAFMEFVKIVALKLLSDRNIRDKYPNEVQKDEFNIPLADVSFSRQLLAEQEKHTANPLSSIWFGNFIAEMEIEISTKKKKRIFEKNDQINLTPETINGVVSKLEHLFLFGIDADLNGRLFETFLSATMRGKDLGQYFTPRSVVKLGVGLANLKVDHQDITQSHRVYDGCCGTGGFLIDVFADMCSKIDNNKSLSQQKKGELKQFIAYNNIFGADIGRDPNLSRIARLNMYLHGDGGSCIFNIDALDKELPDRKTDKPELLAEKKQMREIYSQKEGYFDIVITNPPFAKKYTIGKSKGQDQYETSNAERILSQYSLRNFGGSKAKSELRSNLMFMERYYDVLKKGGKLLTVIDDGILNGKDYAWFRDWLREKFIINAVISLPGDAFQRSMARVKTSILILSKKYSEEETQPDVFMYPCIYVGIDDPARSRTLPIDAYNKQKAQEEIAYVVKQYNEFQNGQGDCKYIVDANKVFDRLDVKHCLMHVGSNIDKWKNLGFKIVNIIDALEPKTFLEDEVIECSEHSASETPLIVRYDGSAEAGTTIFPADTQHNKLYRVSEGDVVISNIAASYGSIAVVQAELSGCVVSSEYTVLTAKQGFEPKMLWAILRSPVVLSEILLVATGANRTRVKWDSMKSLSIPYPNKEMEKDFVQSLIKLEALEKETIKSKEEKINSTLDVLALKNEESEIILSAFKPPK